MYQDTIDTSMTMDIESRTLDGAACTVGGSDVEMNVQGALWDIVDGGTNEAKDTLTIPFKRVWEVVCEKPRDFGEFVKALKKKMTAEEKMKLDEVITLNGMDPANL